MVTNTQITHHTRDPIQHQDMEGYALLTPNHFLPAPTGGPDRIVKVFRPKYFKWQQVFYESRNYSIKDKNLRVMDVTYLRTHFTEGAFFLKQL